MVISLKRMVGLCLIILLVAAAAGCNGISSLDSAATTPTRSPAETISNTTDDQIYEIKWHGSFQLQNIEADTYVERMLEKKFNVKITLVNANMDKLKLMATTNDLPDIIRLADPRDVSSFANTGFTLELPLELLKEQMPHITNSINYSDPSLWGLTKTNNKNYGIPQYLSIVPWDAEMTWRKDILDLAGIAKVPATIAEYDDAFRIISDKKLEIIAQTNPELKELYMFSAPDIQFSHNQFTWLFGAYGSMPGSWQLDAQGKVVRGETLPGTREALAKLAEWYKLGYIDPRFVTDRSQQIDASYYSGRIVMTTKGIGDVVAKEPNALQKALPSVQYVNTTAPKGPNGHAGIWSWGKRQNFVALSSDLKADPKKVNKILQILEAIASDEELYKLTQWGEEGKSYTIIDGVPNQLPPYNSPLSAESSAMGALGAGIGLFGPFGETEIVNKFLDPVMVKEWKEKYSGKPDVTFALELPSTNVLEQSLIEKWVETFVSIIIGNAPLSAYDDYLLWLDSHGGKQLTEEASELYAQRFKIK
ncbi:hypothetical protein EHS13_29795 [Paenibacillus psychroresistens]|uniref:Extracellular solute-binding protein n=1 Tax=Paenibacillus psychroresistens TaxID=1778678 RepID=A0A6B8RQV5_9BACL|nr:extracellular solute-binding protein [Paenibacillus psychroresistens]QGQ98771.1 hypothetical protein EHS13_29795 [Paenibacillus psychroresistens]